MRRHGEEGMGQIWCPGEECRRLDGGRTAAVKNCKRSR